MFQHRIELFSLLGFKVRLDATWFFLALLVTWTLATSYFPSAVEGLPISVYWSMGIAGALGLFASIIFHELCHSLVARRYGLQIGGITLFVFGGVAEMEAEPESPKAEFLMAAAGPASSYVLAALFYAVSVIGTGLGLAQPFLAVCAYLALINTILATFNLVPAFPLDGGRMLRAALWYFKGNYRHASAIASRFGRTFGAVMILLGLLSIFQGAMVAGIWWGLIGFFIIAASGASQAQMETEHFLSGHRVSAFMTPDPETVSPDLTIRDHIRENVYRSYHDIYPVVEHGHVLGLVNSWKLQGVPAEEWPRLRLGSVAEPISDANSIAPWQEVTEALRIMRTSGNSRLVVVADGRAIGILTMKDIMKLVALKLDLEPAS